MTAVAINISTNAALLAARILGATDPEIGERVEKYAKDMEGGVLEDAENLEMKVYEEFLSSKKKT